MKIDKFWICLVPGNKAPVGGFHHHNTLEDAKAEAERLIRVCNAQSVIVFESALAARPAAPPISWEVLTGGSRPDPDVKAPDLITIHEAGW